jgi:hypothetical protein
MSDAETTLPERQGVAPARLLKLLLVAKRGFHDYRRERPVGIGGAVGDRRRCSVRGDDDPSRRWHLRSAGRMR